MARELESLDGSNWRDFIASPRAVLVLGKTDCEKCAKWSAELVEFLAGDEEFAGGGIDRPLNRLRKL